MNVNELMQQLVEYTKDPENTKDPIHAGNRQVFTEGQGEDMFRPLIEVDWTSDGLYLIGGPLTDNVITPVPPSWKWYLDQVNKMLNIVRGQLKADEHLTTNMFGKVVVRKKLRSQPEEEIDTSF